jgi:pyrroline-5-carboxylate reductase
VQHPQKAEALNNDLGIEVGTDNAEAVRNSQIVLVCVKPQTVAQVMEEIAPVSTPDKIIISVAASVPTDYMEKRLTAQVPIIRAMPNTPAMLGAGMTALCGGRFASPADIELAKTLFDTVGRTAVVDEKHMDAITGLSASGPAFIYIILESLAEAGVKVGLPRDLATQLAAQTALGASRMVLETGHHPALLKDAVTTPAGCTIDGILELEEGKLRVTLIKAVVKASQRAKELVYS